MPSPEQLNQALRALPSVNEVIVALSTLIGAETVPHDLLADLIRLELEQRRRAVLAGNEPDLSVESVAADALQRVRAQSAPSLTRVVNATGVVIHTNLGRSALAHEAVQAVLDIAEGYSTLEYDAAHMARGSRHVHCEQLLCTLTGAEAAIAVNNNAAAVLMVLNEFAKDHQAVISRGELIEIGGSFRIPDIMAFSNAEMVEVGTTNKTHPADYERAITPNTSVLLKVHTSNYRLIGFTESVTTKELKRIARAENAARKEAGLEELLVYEDLGSGMLQPLEGIEGHGEPTVAEALAQGCDLVSFSGDKLLGGPQAGIVVGSKPLIDRLKKNPLARALRLDKMTLAALEATLRLYLDPERARKAVPTLRMLEMTADEALCAAEALKDALERTVPSGVCSFEVVADVSRAGGGALPMLDIASHAVETTFVCGSAQACAAYLANRGATPIVARISHDKLLFSPRTLVSPDEQGLIGQTLAAYFADECGAPSH